MNNISIIGGRIIDTAQHIDKISDLHIADGRILGIGAPPPHFQPDQIIDAKNKIVCAGLVDLAVRLREPGQEHKATIASETLAAACNGITSLCCPPDTLPVIDTPAVAELLRQRAKNGGHCRIFPLAALTQGLEGKHLSEMSELKRAGCIGVSNAQVPIANTQVLKNAYEYAANCDLTVFIQPQEPYLGRDGCVHEGAISSRMGLTGIPETAETIAICRDLFLIEQTGVRAHFCRLSSARSVDLIQEAQHRGLKVTADVAAHQLFLTDQDVVNYNSQCHVYPPLRTAQDRDALRKGVLDGVISAICSDHQPHEPEAKLNPFAHTSPGISALDTLLPLALRLEMPLPKIIDRLTWGPAQALGVKIGTLRAGKKADVCIFDPHKKWTLTPNTMFAKCLNTPFMNWEFQGRAVCSIVSGQIVFTEK